MTQLLTLFWLKWTLLRNSLRSRKAVVNKLATLLGMLAALALALLVATGLGFAAYALSRPGAMAEIFRENARRGGAPPQSSSPGFLFFSIFAFIYLMWATLPLSIGSSKQFDAGKLLLYPISLRKLFAIDFVSEVTTLQSVFALPAILAMCVGAGLGTGNLARTLLASIPIVVFGIALSKWLSTSIALLVRRKRARGESILALVGAIAGLGGALLGQVAPFLFTHTASLDSLRWTPPGAAASLISGGNNYGFGSYVLDFLILLLYIVILVVATYFIARRAVLGLGRRKPRETISNAELDRAYSGWRFPLIRSDLSAIVEKEFRYIIRNAQLRMMAVMPLILIVVRLLNSRRFGPHSRSSIPGAGDFFTYGSALIGAGGILYVFMLLAGLACNQFAFEEGGMRTLILSPLDRRYILIGKNIALASVAFVFSILLLTVNALVFRDLTFPGLLFAFLSFVAYASLMSSFGNSLSIRFPKRMQFGKRLNVTGVAGLLLLPMLGVLIMAPLSAALAGYFTRSLLIEYVVISILASVSLLYYLVMIKIQGKNLERREIAILEAVRDPSEDI